MERARSPSFVTLYLGVSLLVLYLSCGRVGRGDGEGLRRSHHDDLETANPGLWSTRAQGRSFKFRLEALAPEDPAARPTQESDVYAPGPWSTNPVLTVPRLGLSLKDVLRCVPESRPSERRELQDIAPWLVGPCIEVWRCESRVLAHLMNPNGIRPKHSQAHTDHKCSRNA